MDVADNEPAALRAGARILRGNLETARVIEDDLRAKLREANVLDPPDAEPGPGGR